MQNLSILFKKKNYKFIYKRNNISLSLLKSKRRYFRLYYEILLRILNNYHFKIKLFLIRNKRVILIHPQTIGYKTIFGLFKSNSIFIYVVDNSFFCIRSYNTHPLHHTECLNCLNTLEPDDECYPEPVRYSRDSNIYYLRCLKSHSKKITFLAQNNNQKKLLIKHFGENIKIRILGMETNELNDDINFYNECKQYDIVYHGKSILSKGIIYVLNLAHELPQFSFLIPDSYSNIEKIYKRKIPKNVTCHELTWESGLKGYIINAKLVLNPSLWSAPIEGALKKSAFYNANVGTVISQYGYEGETNIIKNHLRLSPDTTIAREQLINHFNSQ